ncbi:hypothetical protein BH10PLA2_BH10PLA2_32660 [soil metagenome]
MIRSGIRRDTLLVVSRELQNHSEATETGSKYSRCLSPLPPIATHPLQTLTTTSPAGPFYNDQHEWNLDD